MIPAVFVNLPEMPLNSNGKIDRNALPNPEVIQSMERTYIPPQTPIQQEIAAIWAKMFNVEPIGLTDDFFEIGGHSLLATQLIFHLNDHFHIQVPLREILTRGRTVDGLATVVEELLLSQVSPSEMAELLADLDGLSAEELLKLIKE